MLRSPYLTSPVILLVVVMIEIMVVLLLGLMVMMMTIMVNLSDSVNNKSISNIQHITPPSPSYSCNGVEIVIPDVSSYVMVLHPHEPTISITGSQATSQTVANLVAGIAPFKTITIVSIMTEQEEEELGAGRSNFPFNFCFPERQA